MAELHVFGELCGAHDFPTKSLFALYEFHHGNGWTVLEGERRGQTQTDTPALDTQAIWSHPLDIHYATKGVPGWPKLSIQIWSQDGYGRCQIAGYAYANIPTNPGRHQLQCLSWLPRASGADAFRSFFLGGNPQLRSTDIVYTQPDRLRLHTVTSGKVSLTLNIIMRNFDKFGVEYF